MELEELSKEELSFLQDLEKVTFGDQEEAMELLTSAYFFDTNFALNFLEVHKTWGDIPEDIVEMFVQDARIYLEEEGYELYRYGEFEYYAKTGEENERYQLGERLYQFKEIHNKHLRQWEDPDKIKQHLFSNIEVVYWEEEEDCFHVHYKATETERAVWYHYLLDGTWY